MSCKNSLSLVFRPLDVLCISDDIYKHKVALYNAKETCFYMGEVECDGLKLMVSYQTAEYYGIDIEIVHDFTDWYYMPVDDNTTDVSRIGE